jgi:long-chain acyl-CoA synthetase
VHLTQGLHRSAQLCLAAISTVFGDRRRTWAETRSRVARLAGALQSLGATRGERIGIIALNSDRYLEAYFAITWAGCVTSPSNIRWSAPEHAEMLADCEPSLVFAEKRF